MRADKLAHLVSYGWNAAAMPRERVSADGLPRQRREIGAGA